ncbi:hypothetical protein IIA16_05935 [bacterium]|nr:hypothetical protein [bacterium]
MNILSLGKGTNRLLLEAACQQLCDTEEQRRRPVSYTAVKHRLTAIRARGDQRPTVTEAPAASESAPLARDTSRAHLGGADQFSLDALGHINNSTTGVDHD